MKMKQVKRAGTRRKKNVAGEKRGETQLILGLLLIGREHKRDFLQTVSYKLVLFKAKFRTSLKTQRNFTKILRTFVALRS